MFSEEETKSVVEALHYLGRLLEDLEDELVDRLGVYDTTVVKNRIEELETVEHTLDNLHMKYGYKEVTPKERVQKSFHDLFDFLDGRLPNV